MYIYFRVKCCASKGVQEYLSVVVFLSSASVLLTEWICVYFSNKSLMLVKGCEKVTSPLQCNLTEAFSDPSETYYTSVSAVLRNHTSPPAHCSPFRPITNSKRDTDTHHCTWAHRINSTALKLRSHSTRYIKRRHAAPTFE